MAAGIGRLDRTPPGTGNLKDDQANCGPHSSAETTAEKQRGVPFKPGQSGNPAGRPKGSRHKLGEDFLSALYADFQQHGPAVIAKVRQTKPAAYLKVVASLLPREVKLDAPDLRDLSDAELTAIIKATAAAAGLEISEAAEETPPCQH
ncbi:MAG: putative bacteriophage protein [Microvirga sp.]|jgi:hypothetical protein|nr:putative bacteriophage protein [Microvirga sp.]